MIKGGDMMERNDNYKRHFDMISKTNSVNLAKNDVTIEKTTIKLQYKDKDFDYKIDIKIDGPRDLIPAFFDYFDVSDTIVIKFSKSQRKIDDFIPKNEEKDEETELSKNLFNVVLGDKVIENEKNDEIDGREDLATQIN